MSAKNSDTNIPASAANRALFIGIIGLVIAAIGLVMGLGEGNSRPVFSWLIGLSYWLSILVGMLFLILIWYVFDAGWPIIIRRQLEHAVGAFKWLFLIFLPLLAIAWGYLGDDTGILWSWMNEDKMLANGLLVKEDVLYQHKKAFLNLDFFTIRVVAFFGLWVLLAGMMRKYSYTMDKDGDIKWAHKARWHSTWGLFALALGSTFAAIDWFMAIEFHWFSTMYGVWFFAESMRSALCMIVVLLYILSTRGYLKGLVNQAHYYFVGCLMLAFTMFWAYVSFSQYFLIYNANIPEETFWYNLRELSTYGEKNIWWYVSMGLVFLQFLLPFLLLLQYKVKVKPKLLLYTALWMLFMHLIDLYWNILPGKEVILGEDGQPIEYEPGLFKYEIRGLLDNPVDIVFDLAMLVGVGGIVVWVFLRNAAARKPIPVRDPRILESINAAE